MNTLHILMYNIYIYTHTVGCAADTAIKAGDRLLEVNGESVKQMNHQDALSLIAQGAAHD